MQGLQVAADKTRRDPRRAADTRCGRFEPFGTYTIGSTLCIPTRLAGGGVGFIAWPDTRPRASRIAEERTRQEKAKE